ncbi:MAG TPA: hypothetical protein DHV83_02740 [Prevotella sp.]|nr:hypothetical protein [Prevotella sp.]
MNYTETRAENVINMIKTRAGSLKVYCEKYRPRLALRTSLLPYERNEEAHIVNIPLYMLFVLSAELDGE